MSGYHLDSRSRIAFLSLAVFLMLGAGEFVLDAQNLSKSVNADNVTVEQVIGDIQANSDYVFLYSRAVVKGNRRVNITTRSMDVRMVLDELFAGTDVTSDILFFQKRDTLTLDEPSWVDLNTDASGLKMNQYLLHYKY